MHIGQVGFCRQWCIPFGVTNCKSVSTQAADTASMKASVCLPLPEHTDLPHSPRLHCPYNLYHNCGTVSLCHIWKQRIVLCFNLLCLLVQGIICDETRILCQKFSQISRCSSNRCIFRFGHNVDSQWYWSGSKTLILVTMLGIIMLKTSACFPQRHIHIFLLFRSLGDKETTTNQECEIALSYITSYLT